VSTKANALLSCLERSDALVRLACLKAIGRVMKPLAQALQRKAGDPLRALQLIDETTSILQKIRSGDGSSLSFSGIFEKTTGMADASALLYRNHGFLLVDRYTAAAAAEDSNEDYYRINVFNAAIDAVLADFKDRYGTHLRLSAGLTCLVPSLV